MIAIHPMLESMLEQQDPVDEGFGADLAYTIKKRLPFQKKTADSGPSLKKYAALNQRRSEMGHKYG